jgi:hypothetical protein
VDFLVEANISKKCAVSTFRAEMMSQKPKETYTSGGRRGSLKEGANQNK